MAKQFSIATIFKAIDKVTAPVNRMTSSVTRFAAVSERNLGRLNKSLNATYSALSAGVRSATAAAAAGGVATARITQVGADFEQQITSAAAKFPQLIRRGTEAFDALARSARIVGATTEFSASQAAGGLQFLAMAGFEAEASMRALAPIIDFATSNTLDLASASDIASDALGQFNLTSEDAEQQTANLARIMDVMTATATSANTTVTGLFEAFKQAAPVATAAGQSIETLSTLTASLANSGIKSAQAGTMLRAVFSRLQAPVGKASQVIERLGIQTRDSEGNMLDVIAILDNIGKSLDGLGTAERADILKTIFGEEPIAGVNVLLAAGSKELIKYREQLERAEGTTGRLARVMRDTTANDIKGMLSGLESLTITLFELNRGAIREGIGGFTEWLRAVDKALQSNEDLAQSVGRDVYEAVINLAKVFGILIGAMIALKVATIATSAAMLAFRAASFAVTAATWAWNIAVAALPAVLATARAAMLAFNIVLWANPIGVVIAAITALIAIGILLVKNWDTISEFFVGIWDNIKTGVSSAIDGIMFLIRPFIAVVQSISSIWDQLSGAVAQPINAEINTTQNGAVVAGATVSSPQESIVRSINESSSSAEVTLRNETNTTAEVTQQSGPMGIRIADSGAF